MSEAAVLHPASASPLKAPSKKAKGEKKQKKPSTHPPVNDMIVAALKTLKDRKGTSLQAVKKYISANYTCDVEKLSPFIKKSLKSGVEKGKLVHTKGTGASGSFKLKLDVKKAPGAKKAKGVAKKKPATGEKKARKPKTAGTKAGLKKAKAAPAKKAKKVAGVKKAASLKQKSTKHSKTVAKKPKTPKPKKAAGGAKKKPAAKK